MPIISLSINDKLSKEIDTLGNNMGYSGRSEIVRAAIRNFIAEQNNKLEESKIFNGTITILIPDSAKNAIHDAQKNHEDIIKTNIHQCTKDDKCMTLLIVEGKGKEIKELVKALEDIPKVEFVKLALLP